MNDNNDNDFENLPVDDGIEIVIEYLKAVKKGDMKKINRLFKKYPGLFQPDTLAMAKGMIRNIAKRQNNSFLLSLL